MHAFGARANDIGILVNALHWMKTPIRLELMISQEMVQAENKENLKRDWGHEVQLPARFKTDQLAFFKMLGAIWKDM